MTEFDDMETAVLGRGDWRPISGKYLIRLLRALRGKYGTVDGRLDALEQTDQSQIALSFVADVSLLPVSATPRQWFRVQGDPAVYIGNGGGQPLTKLIPSPL